MEELQQQKTGGRSTGLLLLGGAFALVVIGLGTLFFLAGGLDRVREWGGSSGRPTPEGLFKDMKGKIHLTLAPEGSVVPSLYTFDVRERTLVPLFENYGLRGFGEKYVGFTSRTSPQGNKIAYSSAPLDQAVSYGYSRPLRIFVFTPATQTATGTFHALNDRRLFWTRLPHFSPDGEALVFTGFRTYGDFDFPSKWDIYEADLRGNERFVTNGTYPYFSPDGRFILFMRNDGLYVRSRTSGEERRVYSFGYDAKLNTKIGLSRDGSMLAVSTVKSVRVFDIRSWEPFEMELRKQIVVDGSSFYWPVFSPDSRYLAVQMVDEEIGGARRNARLSVFELDNFESTILADLTPYTFDVSFISDWVDQ